MYYEIATEHAYATTTDIRLVVRIPLTGADRVMTLQKPAPTNLLRYILGRHIQIEPEAPYLAVTENRQYYSILTTANLQQCKGLFTMCEAIFSLAKSLGFVFLSDFLAYKFCRKFIRNENCNPIWLQAKELRPFWIYSLPSPVTVTKKCKLNSTTQRFNIQLSTGILDEVTNCQLYVYSEAFILLPVSYGYTNVSLTSGQVLPRHLPQLISPKEYNQITYNEKRTYRILTGDRGTTEFDC
jgi:hypothetical protein